jgi:hypothetical protein
MSNDINTQCRGAVQIVWPSPSMGAALAEPAQKLKAKTLLDAIPVRTSATHICVPKSPLTELASSMLMMAFSTQLRLRVRLHCGSQTETLYELLSFGVPSMDFPLTSTGTIKNGNQADWIRTQKRIDFIRRSKREKDQHQSSLGPASTGLPGIGAMSDMSSRALIDGMIEEETGIIECPDLYDVLFQQGGKAWNHFGNLNFLALVEETLPTFQATRKHKEKKLIIRNVIEQVKGRTINSHLPGPLKKHPRFLTWDTNQSLWTDITSNPTVLEEKVRIAFRDHGKRLRSTVTLPNASASPNAAAAIGTDSKRRKIGKIGDGTGWDARGDLKVGHGLFGC